MAKKGWMDRGADGLTFGERLGDLLAERGISQAKLAKETGIIQSAISGYIAGKRIDTEDDTTREYRAPDCGSLIALSNYFGVSADYLLGLSKVKTTDNSIQAACNVTGLSEQATKYLIGTKANDPERIHVLNSILEEQHFFELLDEIGRYLGASIATLIVNRIQDDCFADLDKQINPIDAFDEAYQKYTNQLGMIAKSNSYKGFTSLYLEKYSAEAHFFMHSLVSSEEHDIGYLLSELSDIGFTDLCEYRSSIALSHLLKCLRTKHLLKSETEI